jgi:hypothetical protein
MLLTGARANDGHFVLLFQGTHDNCKHRKHLASVLDYTFVFCRDTKAPLAIYCGAEVIEDEDVLNLVAELAEKYSLLSGIVESPFFDELSKALLEVENVNLMEE